jgi:hypothetical protein
MSDDGSQAVRDVADDDGYTWVHRLVLQSFLTHGVMTVDELKPVLATIMTTHGIPNPRPIHLHPPPANHVSDPDRPFHPDDITQPLLTSTIQTVNAKVEPYNFEIRSTLNQHNKALTYAFVNKTSDALTQLATRFSPAEIAYIRRLLDHMFETNNTATRQVMALKHNEASQLARNSRRNRQSQFNDPDDAAATDSQPADQGITIQEADAVLDALVHEAFFEKSRAGYYSLAPRALMELGPYLKEMYNEERTDDDDEPPVTRIHDCEGCRELMTHGIRCNNSECEVRWHDACANQYYRGTPRDARKCPKCKTQCTGDAYVGERADRVAGRQSTG